MLRINLCFTRNYDHFSEYRNDNKNSDYIFYTEHKSTEKREKRERNGSMNVFEKRKKSRKRNSS